MNKNKLFFMVVGMIAILFMGACLAVKKEVAPEVNVKIVTYNVASAAGDKHLRADGLPNVGIGTLVELETVSELTQTVGDSTTTSEILTYAWTIEGPAGTTVTELTDPTTATPSFTPDIVGTYTITLTVTTDGKLTPAPATFYVNAGTYIGLTGCNLGCHSDKATLWVPTRHSTPFTEKANGEKLNTKYRLTYCGMCHTTGFNASPGAVNDGFDDHLDALGTYPEPYFSTKEILNGAPGVFDSLSALYPDMINLANVQCESCHGPGSQHNEKTGKNQIAKSFKDGTCTMCHSKQPRQWELTGHAKTPYRATGECAPCHSGTGFILATDPDYDETAEPANYEAHVGESTKVNCVACHDSHSVNNEHQIRTLKDVTLLADGETVASSDVFGNGQLCVNCHIARSGGDDYADTSTSSDFGPHYSAQTDMYLGKSAAEFGRVMGPSSHVDIIENSCVECHMVGVSIKQLFPEVTDQDKIMELSNNLVGHSFSITYTDADGVKWDNTAPCKECHGDIRSFSDIKANSDKDGDGVIEGVQDEVRGMMDNLAVLLPPVGSTEVNYDMSSDEAKDFSIAQRRAIFNYRFIYQDHSFGIHNAGYTYSLLEAAFDALAADALGRGVISEVKDVPNDLR